MLGRWWCERLLGKGRIGEEAVLGCASRWARTPGTLATDARRAASSGSSASSGSGGSETQEMLDFCGEHEITADVEVIPIQKVNEAYGRLLRSDVKYRFCVDMASLKAE
jgi:hypothetical protein